MEGESTRGCVCDVATLMELSWEVEFNGEVEFVVDVPEGTAGAVAALHVVQRKA
jgi:hypothetical protein